MFGAQCIDIAGLRASEFLQSVFCTSLRTTFSAFGSEPAFGWRLTGLNDPAVDPGGVYPQR
jgi:hypothetical protein